ncbi:MAG: DMT family transporter [Phycisphaerales bacterium]|nr:DMT family transporter [Phycisphaerales bacterium]
MGFIKLKYYELFLSVLLLFVAIIWGYGFIVTKTLLNNELSVPLITFFRFTIAGIALFAYLLIVRRSVALSSHELLGGAFIGIALFAGFALQTLGMKYTSVTKASLYTGTVVMIVPFLDWIIGKKKPSTIIFIATFISFLGIYFLVYPIEWGNFALGDILSLLAAFSFAMQMVITGIYMKKDCSAVNLMFVECWVVALLSFLWLNIDASALAVVTKLFNTFATSYFYLLLYLGLCASLFGFLVQTKVQETLSSTRVSIILSLESLFGVIFAIFIFHELLTVHILIGAWCIIFSVILAESRTYSNNKKRT